MENLLDDKIPETAKKLNELMDGRGVAMWNVFHTLPQRLLQYIVLGTVAYDLGRDCTDFYTADGAGVSAVSISMDGRKGAFLTAQGLSS